MHWEMPKVEHCSLWKSFSTLVKGKAMSVAQLFLSRILIHESQAVKKSRPLEIFPFSICLVFFLEQGRLSSYIACEMHANTHRGFQGPTSRVCFKTLITACRSFCADLSKFAGNIFFMEISTSDYPLRACWWTGAFLRWQVGGISKHRLS